MRMRAALHPLEVSVLLLLVISAASTAKSSGLSSLSRIWIVQGNTASLVPTCRDLCMTVLQEDMQGWRQPATSMAVGLYPCRGNTTDEFWRHHSDSASIESIRYPGFCLAIDYDRVGIVLSACLNHSSSQKWRIEHHIAITNTGDAYPLRIQPQPAEKHSQIQQLSVGPAENSSREVFTVLNYTNPLTVLPRREDTPILKNGGFEECGINPGSAFIVLDAHELIPLCGWHVVEGQVEYKGKSLWPPFEGNRSLHLNSAQTGSPGSLSQTLALTPNSNYSLVFHLAVNAEWSCGSSTKALRVSISPSSLSPQRLVFDVENTVPGALGWKKTHPLEFTALADYTNLTFHSLTQGSCGPVIDNLRLTQIRRPTRHFISELIDPQTHPEKHIGSWILLLFGLPVAIFLLSGVYGLFLMKLRKRASKEGGECEEQPNRPWDSEILSLLVHQRVQKLTWRVLEKATNDFKSEIGEGGFSRVYLARFPDETVGAVKVMKKKDRPSSASAFKEELSLLLRARHVHLVNLIGFCDEREHEALVFEYMANGNLHQRLHPNSDSNAENDERILPWRSRMTIAFQIAAAIEYLHEVCRPPIVHSDIKSANVLLDSNYNAKLCDFGFSKAGFSSASVFQSTVKGSLGYLDPQYCKSGLLSKKSDIYSFGVLLLELVTGMPSFCMEEGVLLTAFADPYVKNPERVAEIMDKRLNGHFDAKEAEAIAGMSALCIQEEANMRPSMTEILGSMRQVLSPSSITASCQELEEIMELHEDEHQSSDLFPNRLMN